MKAPPPPPDTGPRAGWIHGKTIAPNGDVRYTSVSSLTKADPTEESGCPRKWYYEYKEGRKEPPSKAQANGTKLHAEVATYLETGVRKLSPQAAKGLGIFPDPGADLAIEQPLFEDIVGPDGKVTSGLATAVLRAAGIPLVGAIDCRHSRGTHKTAESIVRDPDGTVEVLDWKFTRNTQYAKSGPDLLKTIQMIGYAEYVFRRWPGTPLVRLSHGYVPSEGTARKSTILVDRETIARHWEHPESVARSIQHIAREPTAETVPANTRACRAFGRECVHRPYCSAGQYGSLASRMGAMAKRLQGDTTMALIPKAGGLLDRMKSAAPAAAPATPTAPAVDPAELARLRAEETRRKLAAKVPHGFLDAVNAVQSFGRGSPTLTEAAAVAWNASQGVDSPDTVPGIGELAEVEISDPALLPQVVAELREQAQATVPVETPADAAPSVLPPDAPESDPALATAGPGETGAPAPAPTPASPLASVVASTEKRKPGRPKKAVDAAPAAPAPPVAEVPTVDAEEVREVEVQTVAGPVVVYIDCTPSCTFRRLEPLIHGFQRTVSEDAGAPDPRLADATGKYGYGRWRAIVETAARDLMATEIPPGHYVVTSGSEFVDAFIVGLKAALDGGLGFYVQGAR